GELFAGVDGVEIFGKPDGIEGGSTVDNFWLTSILVDSQVAGWDSLALIEFLAAENIEARPLWKPMHAQPVFADNPRYVDGTSERLFAQGLSLPSGSALTTHQFRRVAEQLNRFLESQS
ncbi:MAG TPA: pyridoxal-5'-phosphate-dependent protein, partial [Propionibacterium sp.]|nr:pyridoxal-5'-phosphate-dependent protein [Propionibacterium sp.]